MAGLLAVGVAATVAGCRSFAAIGQWAADAGQVVLAGLGAARGAAEESTFRRVLAAVDPDRLDTVLGAWVWPRARRVGGRLVVAVDGKTVKGAGAAGHKAPHLVGALAHGLGAVLGQVAVPDRSNEIPAARDLLRGLPDLAGAVVTFDAMHTQTSTAGLVLARGAHYVMCVKANTPTLLRGLKALPWKDVPASTAQTHEGGRMVRRTIKVIDAPAWVALPGAAQVAQLRRTRTLKGRKTVEVVYLVTSADRDTAPPTALAKWVNQHWHIENKLHWVRDVTYQEDKSLVRTGNAPRVMATMRNTAISLLRLDGHDNIAWANRHHARDPARTLALLATT